MIRQKTAIDDRGQTGQARTDQERSDGRLRKSRSFAVALVVAALVAAGLLLARRRDGDETGQVLANAPEELTDAVTRVSERVAPGGTGDGEADESTSRPNTTGDDRTEAEGQRMREEAAAISAPTTRDMPMLGVGTYDDADYGECYASVRQALRIGYRHVDTVEHRESYYNEAAVGEAIDDADVPREDLFVATKVHPSDLDSDHVRLSVDESLDRLGLDYLDLLYVHWPTDEYDPTETLAAFAELREAGVIDRIGVSNFTVDLLEEAIEASDAPVFANQVEMHPLLPQAELREFCDRDDVDVELVAYSPIARGDVEDVSELQAVAEKHDATPEQVSLAWLHEKGVTAIPRATSEDHLLENWLSLDLELDDEDVAMLDSIGERRRIVDRADAPWNR